LLCFLGFYRFFLDDFMSLEPLQKALCPNDCATAAIAVE